MRPTNIKIIRERLRRNPYQTQKKLALQTNISHVSVNRILKYDRKVNAYSRRKVHFSNDRLCKLRRERCLIRYFTVRMGLFSKTRRHPMRQKPTNYFISKLM
ncbi:unnamed protein product, partial [Diatraea saccharalis]